MPKLSPSLIPIRVHPRSSAVPPPPTNSPRLKSAIFIKLIEQNKPLPEKYRFLLFADKREVELVWNGKTREVSTAILPFQFRRTLDRRLHFRKRMAKLPDPPKPRP